MFRCYYANGWNWQTWRTISDIFSHTRCAIPPIFQIQSSIDGLKRRYGRHHIHLFPYAVLCSWCKQERCEWPHLEIGAARTDKWTGWIFSVLACLTWLWLLYSSANWENICFDVYLFIILFQFLLSARRMYCAIAIFFFKLRNMVNFRARERKKKQ